MAIFHLDVTNIHAGKAARASDYRARAGREAALGHHEDGGLVGWAGERTDLWQSAESAETPKRSRVEDKQRQRVVARSVIIALPHELDAEQRAKLVKGFSLWLRDKHGVAVQWDNHSPESKSDPRQFHAHLMVTSRAVSQNGEFGKKTRELDQKPSSSTHLKAWRDEFEQRCNKALEAANLPARVDARSKEKKAKDEGNFVSLAPKPRVPVRTWMRAKQRGAERGKSTPVFNANDQGVESLRAYNEAQQAILIARETFKEVELAQAEVANEKTALERIKAQALRVLIATQERIRELTKAPSPIVRKPTNQRQESR